MKSELTVPIDFKCMQHAALFFVLLFFLTGCASTQLAGFDVEQPGESQLDACPQISGYFSQTGQTIRLKGDAAYPLSEKGAPQALIDIFSMALHMPRSMSERIDPLAPVHIQTDQDKLSLIFTLTDQQTYTLSVPEAHSNPSSMASSARYCRDGRLLLLQHDSNSMYGEAVVWYNHALVLRVQDGALLVDARYEQKSHRFFMLLPFIPLRSTYRAQGQFRFDPH